MRAEAGESSSGVLIWKSGRERERALEREREVVSIEMLTRPLDPAALWIFLT